MSEQIQKRDIEHIGLGQLQQEYGQEGAAVIAAMVINRRNRRMRPGMHNSQRVHEITEDIDQIAQNARDEATRTSNNQTAIEETLPTSRATALEQIRRARKLRAGERERERTEARQIFSRRFKRGTAGAIIATFLLVAACNGYKYLPKSENPEAPLSGANTRNPDGSASEALGEFLQKERQLRSSIWIQHQR